MIELRGEKLDGERLAREIANICEDRKAEDIVVYDVTGLSLLTDYYLICTVKSEPQLRGVAGQLQKQLEKYAIKPDRVDGAAASKWIVIDYGSVLVHIFHTDLRRYYEIDKLFDDERLIIGGE